MADGLAVGERGGDRFARRGEKIFFLSVVEKIAHVRPSFSRTSLTGIQSKSAVILDQEGRQAQAAVSARLDADEEATAGDRLEELFLQRRTARGEETDNPAAKDAVEADDIFRRGVETRGNGKDLFDMTRPPRLCPRRQPLRCAADETALKASSACPASLARNASILSQAPDGAFDRVQDFARRRALSWCYGRHGAAGPRRGGRRAGG